METCSLSVLQEVCENPQITTEEIFIPSPPSSPPLSKKTSRTSKRKGKKEKDKDKGNKTVKNKSLIEQEDTENTENNNNDNSNDNNNNNNNNNSSENSELTDSWEFSEPTSPSEVPNQLRSSRSSLFSNSSETAQSGSPDMPKKYDKPVHVVSKCEEIFCLICENNLKICGSSYTNIFKGLKKGGGGSGGSGSLPERISLFIGAAEDLKLCDVGSSYMCAQCQRNLQKAELLEKQVNQIRDTFTNSFSNLSMNNRMKKRRITLNNQQRSSVEVKQLQIRIKELEQERHALRLRLESLEAEYETTVQELQDDVHQLRQDLQGQQQQLTAGDKDKVNIIRELKLQNERLTDQVQHAAEMEGQLVSEVEGLRSQVSLRMTMPDQLDQLDTLQSRISELLEKKCEVERKIHVLTEERDSYACSLEESQERILVLEKQKLEQELHIRNQGREIYELQEVNHQLQAQIENLSQRSSYTSSRPPTQTLFNELSGLSVDTSKEPAVISVQDVFLPQGYPDSVSEDYLTYQIWDSVQAFSSSITGTLATQSILKGIGVGNDQATVLSATLTWLLKDCTGMLGNIFFAWMQGTNLDCNAKRYRLMADVFNDVAIFLDIMTSLLPAQLFVVMVCLSSLCRSIVGVAAGSTRAAMSQHQARRNNMADVALKDGSQETLVNITALIFNLVLTPFVAKYQQSVFYVFSFFTMLHLFANYSAIRAVTMETLNQARLCIIVQEFLRSSRVMGVKQVNMREPLIFGTHRKMALHLGCSIKKIYPDEHSLSCLKDIYKDSKYIVFADLVEGHIYILLCKESQPSDQLEGCFQAEVINAAVDNLIPPQTVECSKSLQKLLESVKASDAKKVMEHSLEFTHETFPAFEKVLHTKGWVTDKNLLGADEWRVDLLTNKKQD